MLPSLASLSCRTGVLPPVPTALPPPVRLLGFDYWVHVLEQLDPEVSACADVVQLCKTLRLTGKELGQQTPCDDAHFWERMCQTRVFLFYSPEYVPIASTSELDRWRKQYLLFCRVATGYQGHADLNALRTLGLVATIEASAFQNCRALALTHLPEGVTTIGEMAFQNCPALALTHLPEGLTTIGHNAFANCHALALTHLPEGLTTIGICAFEDCRALALTHLPEGVTTIGSYAFNCCSALALTRLPEGLITIGRYAFVNCRALALTHLPEGLTTIEDGAFLDCSPQVQQLANKWREEH